MTSPLLFESEPCPRCGGTGHHSYNRIHGTKCYGCGGAGVRLTKRGRAAQDFHTRQTTKRAFDVRVGDRIRVLMVTCFYWVTVTSVTHNGPETIIEFAFNGGTECWHLGNGHEVRFRPHDPEPLRQRALAYQSTLNKAGKETRKTAALFA